MNPVQAVGRSTLAMVRTAGSATVFAGRGVAAVLSPPVFPGQLWRQLAQIGYFSLPVVGLTAVFTGAALALNIYTGGGRFNAEQIMPQIVALGITRELGPVLAALMLAGRVSAAIAAEIGATPAQVELAWLLAQSENIAPIPDTRRMARIEENVGAVAVQLTDDQLSRLSALPPATGNTHNEAGTKMMERPSPTPTRASPQTSSAGTPRNSPPSPTTCSSPTPGSAPSCPRATAA